MGKTSRVAVKWTNNAVVGEKRGTTRKGKTRWKL